MDVGPIESDIRYINTENELETYFFKALKNPDINKNQCNLLTEKLHLLNNKKIIKSVDDFCLKFFEGENVKKIVEYKNIYFLEEVMINFVWYRLHRHAIWHKVGEVYKARIGAISKIENIILRAERFNKNSGVFACLKAAVYCANENWDEVEKLFMNAQFDSKHFCSNFFGGRTTFLNPYSCVDLVDPKEDLKEMFNYKLDKTEKINREYPIYLYSCDINYFNQFALSVIENLNSIIKKCNIIFVLVVKDKNFDKSIYNKVISEFSNVEVLVAETNIDDAHIPALSASARYLFISELMKFSDLGIFVFDIDFEISTEMIEILNDTRDNNKLALAINIYGRALYPWCQVHAASTYIPNNEAGRFFYTCFSNYFFKVFSDSKTNWWIDQNGLFAAYKLLQRHYPSQLISNFIDIRNIGATNGNANVIAFKKNLGRLLRN